MGASLAMAAALCASDARAQFYLGAEGGWTGLEGTKTSINGTNPVTGQTFNFPINQSFDGGFNVGARAGYQMGPWRFEGEYSFRENGSNFTRFGARLNGTVDTNSLMANAIYDFNIGWPLTPHIGMGIGGASLNGNLDGPVIGYRSKTSDVVFAYQAIAGARYMFTPTLAFDLDYRYRGTSDATYTTRAFTLAGVTFPSRKYTGSGNTNNVVASLTYLFGAAPPPPYAPPPMPPAPPPQAARVFLVFFDWSKDTVTSEGMAIIQQAAAAYKAGGAVQIQVTGYTDRSGSPGYNQRLSERRANNVAKALAGMGVPQNQMAVSGHGENDNRVPTADGVREPQNRRVEITSS
jgi:outer membrane protein OmpA-like peptidoglycan-associated protein